MRAIVIISLCFLCEIAYGKTYLNNKFCWNPLFARYEAISDIKAAAIKVYLAGSENSIVGIPPQLLKLVATYPMVSTGCTDTIEGEGDRLLQELITEYCVVYNQTLVRELLGRQGRDPAELDSALADKTGQVRAIREYIAGRRRNLN